MTAGTTVFVLTGGTLTGSGPTFVNPIQIAGNVTLSGTINVGGNGKSLTYTSGTLIVAGSTLNVASGSYTFTINGAGFILATLSLTGNTIFTGTAGFSMLSLVSAVGLTHSFKSGLEYIINNAISLSGTSGSHIIIASATPSSPTFFRCAVPVASQSVSYVEVTDIDASHGRKIYNASGTLIRSPNWTLSNLWGRFVMTVAGQKVQINSASAGKIRIAQ